MIDGGWFDISGSVAYGMLEINRLGWHDGYQPTPLTRSALDGWEVITAHAPSRVELRLSEPAEVFGFLNLSACFDRTNPVEFWADCNYLGQADKGAGETVVVRLEPSRHVLLADPLGNQTYGRHSLWALRRTESRSDGANTVATPENTAVAAYASDSAHRSIRSFAYSCRKQGIWFEALGVGQRYENHYESKIRRMHDSLAALPERYTHIFFADGKDSVFLRPLSDLCDAFNGMGQPIVVGAEAGCYPYRGADWANRFPRHPTGRNGICAGYWMGRRAALIEAMDAMIGFSQEWSEGRGPVEFARYRDWSHDDQFLWQVSQLAGFFPFALDYDCRLGVNVATQDVRLVGNQDFLIEPGMFADRFTGNRPCLIHFSGAYHRCMGQWIGLLDAV